MPACSIIGNWEDTEADIMDESKKKIVFFDIDGTIYSFLKGVPADTAAAIRALKENGHIPVICTGRTRSMVFNEITDLGFDHMIAGAGTYVESGGEEIHNEELDEDRIRELVDGYRRHGFFPIAEGRDFLYMDDESGCDLTPEAAKFIGIYRHMLADRCLSFDEKHIHAAKVSAGYTPLSDPAGMIDEFRGGYSCINHNGMLLELIKKGTTKAGGIEILLDHLKIPVENTYAFGDSFNDLEMLKYVKYGVAMGNSDPEIFKEVSYRTGKFDEGGIADALERFGLIWTKENQGWSGGSRKNQSSAGAEK